MESNSSHKAVPLMNPAFITFQQLSEWKTRQVKPIEGLTIPNITIPDHLSTNKSDPVSISIRHLFNSLREDNIKKVTDQLRAVVYEKAKNMAVLNEISEEMLTNFLIYDQNIKTCMHMLNAIHNCSIIVSENEKPKTIGALFLEKCKVQIYADIDENNIRMLAELNTDDIDQTDIYNRKREKINNLIITICNLYEQRTTVHIKLTGNHLYPVITRLLDTYQKLQQQLIALGDPYEDKCSDEKEYETIKKMCTLYAEQLYTFMSLEGGSFKTDPLVIKDQTMMTVVDRFNKEVVPTLTETYLIYKCKALGL